MEIKQKPTFHLNNIENNVFYHLSHIYTQYYLSSENNFLLYTQLQCKLSKCYWKKMGYEEI